MKITIVLGAFFPVPPVMGGAVEKVWFALGQEFVRAGHEVVQVSRSYSNWPQREQIAGVNHLRVSGFDQPRSRWLLKFYDLIYSWRVRPILPKADILVTNTFWLPIIQRNADRGRIYVHVQRGPKGQMRWYGHAARLLAVSQAIADAIVRQAPQLQSKVRVIPNPVPFQTSGPTHTARSETILFVGRIHPEKGIELLLRAFIGLAPNVLGNWNLKIIGPHETRLGGGGTRFFRAMQQLSGEKADKIEWVGSIFDPNELQSQYCVARIFVYPSLAETGEALPVAPIEAMANGLVPIVSNLDVFRDYIDDGVTGFTFDHRGQYPETNLRERLAELLHFDSNALAKLGDAARTKAAEFGLQPIAGRYLEDFESLLAGT